MDIETNEVYRNMNDVPEDRKEYAVQLDKALSRFAAQLLNGENRATATDKTEAGRKLLEFAKKEKRRKQNRAARRARKKTRTRRKG